MNDESSIDEILHYWFDELNEAGLCAPQQGKLWFGYNEATDREIQSLFGERVGQALAGQLDHWQHSDGGLVALVILLDQLTRNIYRGTPAAFSGDGKALALSRRAVEAGRDGALATIHRVFLYIPYEHAEDLATQDAGVALFDTLMEQCPAQAREQVTDYRKYMLAHRDVIARFGRFPHRNAILGRDSSAEELAYLEQHGGF